MVTTRPWLDFTPELVALVLQAPIVADYLSLSDGSCAKLAPAQFHNVLLHFSPTDLYVGWCHLRACQINDEFIQTLSMNRVLHTSLLRTKPVDGNSFCVTDDAIVNFFVQRDAQLDEERGQREELTVYRGSFTKDLFKRLVEANPVSMRTRPLRITVSALRFEDKDLRDYAQNLSYSDRG
ncbi:hypothetical protein AAVH_21884 [Aphelenchoides avenae]|nr:hypothetical protein AAVH_21884 [Aphelenchus avenae]